jgi:hypothetical protein
MAYSSIRGSNFHANRLGTIRAGEQVPCQPRNGELQEKETPTPATLGKETWHRPCWGAKSVPT